MGRFTEPIHQGRPTINLEASVETDMSLAPTAASSE